MTKIYPHSQAAFINAIRDEGTKDEACDWLQSTWNELVALRAAVRPIHQRYMEAAGDAPDASSVKMPMEFLSKLSAAYEGSL